jgi:hypothetical protein
MNDAALAYYDRVPDSNPDLRDIRILCDRAQAQMAKGAASSAQER